uniref:Uncharacterized protein n=1 Tax=Caenorhabditis japonica TaxID=281687 RepID=A0A8R1I3P3_CAEJA
MELYRSTIYTIALFVNLAMAVCSIGLIAAAVRKLMMKSIINTSTRIFLVVGLAFCTTHQTAYIVLRIQLLFQILFQLDEPCELYYKAYDCRFVVFGLVLGNFGMILIQSAMTIDQILATALPKFWPKMKYWPGVVLSVVVIILDYGVKEKIFWDDPLTDYVPACGTFPPKSVKTFTFFLQISFCMSIAHMIIICLVLFINRRQERSQRFVTTTEDQSRSFNVEQRYHARETLKTTQAIFFLSMSQFFFMFLYTLFTNVYIIVQKDLTALQSGLVLAVIYTTPYTCIALPALIIITLCFIKNQRLRSIEEMRNQTETGDEHIRKIQELWNK